MKDHVYFFAAGNYSTDHGIFLKETFGIWKLDLTEWDEGNPKPVLISEPSDLAWGRGTVLSAWNETHILIAGGMPGVIHVLDTETGIIDVAFPFGFASLHAMRVEEPDHSKVLYFTIGEGDLFSISMNPGLDFHFRADTKPINSGLQLRDFDTADDGMLYATSSSYNNSIVMVTSVGSTKLVGDLSGSMSRSALATGKTADDIIRLYVSTMQSPDGSTPAKILSFDLSTAEVAVDLGATYTLAPEGSTPEPSNS